MTVILLAAILGLLLLVYTVRVAVILAKALLLVSAVVAYAMVAPLVGLLRSRPG